jgi:hypothetical protein
MINDRYALIGRSAGAGRPATLLTVNAQGTRALAVFEFVGAAEDHLLYGGFGGGWEVLHGARESLVGLLREKVAPHIPYVTIDPPASLRGGEALAVALIPIEEFLDRLETAE